MSVTMGDIGTVTFAGFHGPAEGYTAFHSVKLFKEKTMPGFDDDLWLGPVTGKQTNNAAGSAPPSRGFGPLGRVYIYDIVPATLSTTAVCAAQASTGANNPLVINGASATGGVYTADYARCLTFVSSNAGDTTQTVTVTGTNMYGYPMTSTITLTGTTPVAGTKAFKTVTGVTVSATLTGNISIGNNDKFGLPAYISNAAYIVNVKWNATLAADAGTFVAGDTTSPATAATTDTMGCFTPSSAANGTRRLVMCLALTGLQVGPSATLTGLLGVTPA